MTEEELKTIEKIENMAHLEMCKLWRFAPAGHPYFRISGPYYKIFEKRLFNHFGGLTPKISKQLKLK